MIATVIPAHNEKHWIDDATAILAAEAPAASAAAA